MNYARIFCFFHLIITSSCQFQCHCADDNECMSEGFLESGRCLSGCKTIEGEDGVTIGEHWSGPGCQVGNIVQQSTLECYDHGQPDHNLIQNILVDGFINKGGCFHTNYTNIKVRFNFPVVIFNISLALENRAHSRNKFKLSITNPYKHIQSDDFHTMISIQPVDVSSENLYIVGDEVYVCELIINGYQYTECEPYKDEFYYGPGCLLKCKNCAEQCHMISGECSTCTSTTTGPGCDTCISGFWGEGCDKECHCKNESCSGATGECPLTGCAHGYGGDACDYLLPILNHTTPIIKYDKSDLTISLHDIDHLSLNTSFVIEYTSKNMEWIQYTQQYNKKEIEKGVFFVYPDQYDLSSMRIIPFDLQYGVLGIPSNYVHIYTILKYNNGKLSESNETGSNKTDLSQTLCIVIMFKIALLSSVITSIICICKQRYTNNRQSCAEYRKEKTLEVYTNYECVLNDTPEKRHLTGN